MVILPAFRNGIYIYTSRYPSTHPSILPRLHFDRRHLHLDALKKPVLHVIKDGIVLNDSEVLRLAEELLVWVDTGAEHLLALLGTHLAHLLGHLVRG